MLANIHDSAYYSNEGRESEEHFKNERNGSLMFTQVNIISSCLLLGKIALFINTSEYSTTQQFTTRTTTTSPCKSGKKELHIGHIALNTQKMKEREIRGQLCF